MAARPGGPFTTLAERAWRTDRHTLPGSWRLVAADRVVVAPCRSARPLLAAEGAGPQRSDSYAFVVEKASPGLIESEGDDYANGISTATVCVCVCVCVIYTGSSIAEGPFL